MPKKIPEGTCPKPYLGQDLDLDPEPVRNTVFDLWFFSSKNPM
jgi:hypothetical protein